MKKFLIATTLALFLAPVAALAQEQAQQPDTSALVTAANSIPTYSANDPVLADGQ